MRMHWRNKPPVWEKSSDDSIIVFAGAKTDFWRKTHDGGVRDNGHFYYEHVLNDFTAEVKVAGKYGAQYDQAGLMVWLDKANWMKCGVELLDGVQQASAVVTRDYSDWSVTPMPQNPPEIWLRVTRHGSTLEVFYSLDGASYTLIRQAYLTSAEVKVGPMCAAPTGDGFKVMFTGFDLQVE